MAFGVRFGIPFGPGVVLLDLFVGSMCPIGAYTCHRGRLGWSGTSGLRRKRGTTTHYRRKLNLPVWPTTGMAQTGRLTHRYGIIRVCAIWVCLVEIAKDSDQKPRKPSETQGPCPVLREICIRALTEGDVMLSRPKPCQSCDPSVDSARPVPKPSLQEGHKLKSTRAAID